MLLLLCYYWKKVNITSHVISLPTLRGVLIDLDFLVAAQTVLGTTAVRVLNKQTMNWSSIKHFKGFI
uniref:Uncharacterized protein n=1 Tax=Tetranychus urticae TaxID=32264 RepID=T1KV80_TETUR